MKNDPFFKFTGAVILLGVVAAFANPAAQSAPQPAPTSPTPAPVAMAAVPNTAPAAALDASRPHRHHRAVQKT